MEVAFGVAALHRAMTRALRGHRRDGEAARFAVAAGPELCALSRDLLAGTWTPGPARAFPVRDPKPRTVVELPFRDRVVHHALLAAIEPALDAQLDPCSYACRRGMGVHRAARCVQELMGDHSHALSLDVQKYFETLPHLAVTAILEDLGVPPSYRALCARILGAGNGSGRGMHIGALTSQLFGNLGLHPVEVLLRRDFPDTDHAKYMDDLVILGPGKRRLWEARDAVATALAGLGLALRPEATRLVPVSEGVSFVGLRIHREVIRVPARARVRLGRRIRATAAAWARGATTTEQARASVAGCVQAARGARLPALDRLPRGLAET
ncbi:MAG: hypothetical protein AMXMBFR64_33990 [Myxococcales bacterium]